MSVPDDESANYTRLLELPRIAFRGAPKLNRKGTFWLKISPNKNMYRNVKIRLTISVVRGLNRKKQLGNRESA
jgi:hypothetical protein